MLTLVSYANNAEFLRLYERHPLNSVF